MQAEEYDEDDRYVVLYDCTVVGSSDKAILVTNEDLPAPIWIPTRGDYIHDDSEVYASGTEGMLIISKWIAEKKGVWSET